MAQEDDLRALGKVMDFMRGISVIFLLINCYWFCYEAFHEWHFTLGIINKILMNFQRTTGLFSSILWTKLFCVVFLALSCLGTKGVKERENYMAEDLGNAFRRFCLFLSQLVALSIAYRQDRSSFALHLHAVRWLYLSADGWRMDEPTAQKQFNG